MKGGFKEMKEALQLLENTEIGEASLSVEILLYKDEKNVSLVMHGIRLHNDLWLTPKEFYEFVELAKEASINLEKHFNK